MLQSVVDVVIKLPCQLRSICTRVVRAGCCVHARRRSTVSMGVTVGRGLQTRDNVSIYHDSDSPTQ